MKTILIGVEYTPRGQQQFEKETLLCWKINKIKRVQEAGKNTSKRNDLTMDEFVSVVALFNNNIVDMKIAKMIG